MSRRVPASAMLVALVALRAEAQDSSVAAGAVVPADIVVRTDSVALVQPDTATSIASVSARPKVLVFPVSDARGSDTSMMATLFGDQVVQQINRDTIDHGLAEAWLGSRPATISEAESLSRGTVQSFIWLERSAGDSGRDMLRATLRTFVWDSGVVQKSFPFPDSAESALATLPRGILLALYPRAIPVPPKPVALTDSVKPVVLLLFSPEGSTTQQQANAFTDSLASRMKGLDGFVVLPSKSRDSLLAGWDPGECLTASCRREVGERTGSPWLVAGRLVQLGDKWHVRAELVRTDSAVSMRTAVVQCQGAPAPSMKLAAGMAARQLAGLEKPRKELADTPVAREPAGPIWSRILALGVATTLGLVGVILSW